MNEPFGEHWLAVVNEYYGDVVLTDPRQFTDEDALLHWMATAIFDNDGSVSGDMKKLFPQYWKKALKRYNNGQHDT